MSFPFIFLPLTTFRFRAETAPLILCAVCMRGKRTRENNKREKQDRSSLSFSSISSFSSMQQSFIERFAPRYLFLSFISRKVARSLFRPESNFIHVPCRFSSTWICIISRHVVHKQADSASVSLVSSALQTYEALSTMLDAFPCTGMTLFLYVHTRL